LSARIDNNDELCVSIDIKANPIILLDHLRMREWRKNSTEKAAISNAAFLPLEFNRALVVILTG
jgi:hypothetical protein